MSSRAAINLILYGNPAGKRPAVREFKKKVNSTLERMVRQNKIRIEDTSKWISAASLLEKKYKQSL